MCGRFATHTPSKDLAERFEASHRTTVDPRKYNIAPSQQVLAVRNNDEGERELVDLRWGLVPSWAKDVKTGYSMINARAETVAEKPSFKRPLKSRRCLIAADGFYEWQKYEDGSKQPYFIHLQKNEPFAFAGLWEHWEGKDELKGKVIESCTIIVTRANRLMQPIHDRMPVILPPKHYKEWLNPDIHDPKPLLPLLMPLDPELMEAWPVSSAVNNPRNEGEELLTRIS
jgi:putative SOS response-associated peptidase YedK